jgi:hypothetical protein
MRNRCNNPNNKEWWNYGGRGIKVCQRWQDSYENFLADMGRRPSLSHSIERQDNNKGYEPGNCRWATPKEQGANRRAPRPSRIQRLRQLIPTLANIVRAQFPRLPVKAVSELNSLLRYLESLAIPLPPKGKGRSRNAEQLPVPIIQRIGGTQT